VLWLPYIQLLALLVRLTYPFPMSGESQEVLTKKQIHEQQLVQIHNLLSKGETKTQIAKDMGISLKTLHNWLSDRNYTNYHKNYQAMQKEAVEKAARPVRTRLSRIAEMVGDEVLRLKDRSAGIAILKETGVFEAVRPVKQSEEGGGRIVIEWSGAPPPWAPKPVLEAYAARQVNPALPPQVPPVLHEDVQDAEVVPGDANGQDSQAGQ